MSVTYQADINSIKELLFQWVKRSGIVSGLDWLNGKINLIRESNQKKDIFLAFSAAARFVGKAQLQLTEEDFKIASVLRPGWTPVTWTSDQAARILLILSIPHKDVKYFKEILNQLFETAEVAELTALYLGLPLYPYPEELPTRASEGFRTNMNVVFNAIALNNPYPKDYLDEPSWNQMVLKAVFIGCPLYQIQGIDERANTTLAKTLSDYAHERWAAKRAVSPELWRPVGAFVDEKIMIDIQRVFDEEDSLQKKAAALVCASGNLPALKSLLEKYPDLKSQINNGQVTWDKVGKELAVSDLRN